MGAFHPVVPARIAEWEEEWVRQWGAESVVTVDVVDPVARFSVASASLFLGRCTGSRRALGIEIGLEEKME